MKPYALNRREKNSTDEVPKNHRKKLGKQKVKDRRELRKSERKALRDEYGF